MQRKVLPIDRNRLAQAGASGYPLSVQRVTLKAVAVAAGVHPSTVSLALRNRSRIPLATRKRISLIAKNMGYQPDPVLAALNAYRINLQTPISGVATLGWMVVGDAKTTKTTPAFVSRYLEGARERARALGFSLDEIAMEASPAGQRQAARILIARGIRGLLIPPVSHGLTLTDFPWDQFSAVSFGYSLAKPELTRVAFDHVSGMAHILMALHELGYRRVGLQVTTDSDATERTRQVQIPRILEGSYLAEYTRLFGPPPPVFFNSGEAFQKQFCRWVSDYSLDALVLHGDQALQHVYDSELRVPEDIGVALSMRDPDDSTFAGTDQNDRELGRQAVDILDGLLRHNTRGESCHGIRVLVCGRWRMGTSVQSQSKSPRRGRPRAGRSSPFQQPDRKA